MSCPKCKKQDGCYCNDDAIGMNVDKSNSLKQESEDLNLMNDLPDFKKDQKKDQEIDVEEAKTEFTKSDLNRDASVEDVQIWLTKKFGEQVAKDLRGANGEKLFNYSDDQLGKIVGKVDGFDIWNKLHPKTQEKALQNRLVLNKDTEERRAKLPKILHPAVEISSRNLFMQSFSIFAPGCTINISSLSLGETPKHFNVISPLLVTQQLYDICQNVKALVALPPTFGERKRVLCGPMGVGKSYIAWGIAAFARSLSLPVLYIADASNWVTKYPAEDLMISYLINRFLLLNEDILSEEHKSWITDSFTFTSLMEVLAHTNSIIIIDEHSAILDKKHYQWMPAFITLNALDTRITLVLAASSHSSYEIQYLRNGMQSYKVFVLPPTEAEAIQLFKLLKRTEDDEQKIQNIVRELGNVPRDIMAFCNTTKDLPAFIVYRVQQYYLEIVKYFESLRDQSKFATTIFTLLFHQSYSPANSIQQELGDFIDLSVCYRKSDTELVSLSQATSRALIQFYNLRNPFSLQANITSSLINPNQNDFECFIWSLLLRDAVGKTLTFEPYYLNGSKAAKMEISFQQIDNLEKDRAVPSSYHSQNILYRPWPNFPRWDFVSPSCFFQVSISRFSAHNEKTAKIDLSFGESSHPDRNNPNNAETLALITGSNQYTSKIDNSKLCVYQKNKVIPFKFIYITLDKPNHPKLYENYRNLLVLSAREVWGNAL